MSADDPTILIESVSEESVWPNIVIESRDSGLCTLGRLALQANMSSRSWETAVLPVFELLGSEVEVYDGGRVLSARSW